MLEYFGGTGTLVYLWYENHTAALEKILAISYKII